MPEFLFSSREDFRKWLSDNAQASEGVWLVFGKTKAVATLYRLLIYEVKAAMKTKLRRNEFRNLNQIISKCFVLSFKRKEAKRLVGFDYLKDCGEVMCRVEKLAWNFDPATKGYEWNEAACQDYQRHYPEVIGYEVLRPVKKR